MRKVLLVFLLVFAFGCAGTLERNLNRAMGNMTYDEALKNWGAPSSVTEGENVFVAIWTGESKKSLRAFESGYKLQLTFDRETKIMTGWKYDEY